MDINLPIQGQRECWDYAWSLLPPSAQTELEKAVRSVTASADVEGIEGLPHRGDVHYPEEGRAGYGVVLDTFVLPRADCVFTSLRVLAKIFVHKERGAGAPRPTKQREEIAANARVIAWIVTGDTEDELARAVARIAMQHISKHLEKWEVIDADATAETFRTLARSFAEKPTG